MQIIVRFNVDRWEVVRRNGYRETLIAFRSTKREALELAVCYRAEEGC